MTDESPGTTRIVEQRLREQCALHCGEAEARSGGEKRRRKATVSRKAARIVVEVTDAMYREVCVLTLIRGKSRSRWIRELIADELNRAREDKRVHAAFDAIVEKQES